MSGKRLLLFGAAGSLCITATLAIGILLLSEFGETQGRILGTTALIGAFGLLALPAGILFDQRRHRALGAALVALCGLAFGVAIAVVWTPDAPDALGKTAGSVTVLAAATAQTAALAARRTSHDPRALRRLFAASFALAFVVASMLTAAFWGATDRETYFRILAAVAVADVLTVALQPLMARLWATGRQPAYRFRLYLDSGEKLDLEVEAAGFVEALSKAVRIADRTGQVRRVDRLGSADPLGRGRRRNPSRGRVRQHHEAATLAPPGERRARRRGTPRRGDRADSP